MPRKAQRFHKRADLKLAAKAECQERWRDRWKFDWSDEVAQAWFTDPPTERELEARRLAKELADALQAAVNFCELTPPDSPLFSTEGALVDCLRALNPEPGLPEWAKDCDDLEYEPSDISVIERLRKYSAPHFPESRERADVLTAAECPWRLRLPEHLREKLSEPPMDEDEEEKAFLGPMRACEIAWASILLGNFPDITASELRHGVTVAEAIARETHAIRAARRRADVQLRARIAGLNSSRSDD